MKILVMISACGPSVWGAPLIVTWLAIIVHRISELQTDESLEGFDPMDQKTIMLSSMVFYETKDNIIESLLLRISVAIIIDATACKTIFI